MNRSEYKNFNPEKEEDQYKFTAQQSPYSVKNFPLISASMSHQEEIIYPKIEVGLINQAESSQIQLQRQYSEYKIAPEDNNQEWQSANHTIEKLKEMLGSFPAEIHTNNYAQKLKNKEQNIFGNSEKRNIFEQTNANAINIHRKVGKAENEIQTISFEQEKLKKIGIPISLHRFISKMIVGETINGNPELFDEKYQYFESLPELKVYSQVISFSFSSLNENKDLSSSKKHQKESSTSFIEGQNAQGMIEHFSTKVGKNPIYFLSNEIESDQDRSNFTQEKLSICMNENSVKGFQEPLVDSAEYYENKEKLSALEQQKGELFEQLKIADSDIKMMKQEILSLKKAILNLKAEKRDIFQILNNRVIIAQSSLVQSKEEYSMKQKQIKQLLQKNKKMEQQNKKIAEVLKDHHNFKQYIQIESEKLRQFYCEQIEKLRAQLSEKNSLVEELQEQIEKNMQKHKVDYLQFEKMVDTLKKQIHELNLEVSRKKLQISLHSREIFHRKKNLLQEFDETKIEQVPQLQGILSGEIQKMKGDYNELLLQKSYSLDSFRLQNERLKEQIQVLCEKSTEDGKLLREYQEQIKILKREEKKYAERMVKKKISLSSHYENELEFLRKQVIQKNNQIEVKQKQIKELSIENRKLKKPEASSFLIDFVNTNDQQTYILELKQIISQYQKVIVSNEIFVKQLESCTEDFINDLIQQEKKVENLAEKLAKTDKDLKNFQEENKFLSIDNKKMWKMIINSGKHINAISRKVKSKRKQKSRVCQDSQSLPQIQKLNNKYNQTRQKNTVKIYEYF